MTYKELQDAVAAKVLDTSPTIVAMIPDVINEAIGQIADEVPLPSLKSLGTITTVVGQEWVNISSTITNFSGRLLYIGTANGGITVVDGGLEQLVQSYPKAGESGDIGAVALEGNILWYRNTPTVATTLTIVYYKEPALLTSDSHVPSDLPWMLHRDLIVNKASSIIFDHIEEGLEGNKVNMQSCLGQYEIAKNKLSAWLHKRRLNVGRSVWDV
jgi:hypothetical protein